MAQNRGITVGIVGAGKIGATIATLLESCAFCEAVVLADVRTAVKIAGLGKASVTKLDAEQRTALTAFVKRCDAIVSAVPYFHNRQIVETCAAARRKVRGAHEGSPNAARVVRRGGMLILKVIHTNKALLSDFEYTRSIGDADCLRSFSEGRYDLGLRVNGEWIDAPDEQVPFWELAELGGQDTLRGFFPNRFLGKGRVLLNGEARLRIFDFFDLWNVHIDGVVFGDGGRVFLDREDLEGDFQLGDIADSIIHTFQYRYGADLRFKLSQAPVARVDAGFSDEETGLVYLSFGQTF